MVFSTLSTIIGFGSLMLSHHRGIFSIGLLLTLGVASVLLASLTTLPSLLAILSARSRQRAEVPRARGLWSPRGSTVRLSRPRQPWPARHTRVPRMSRRGSQEPVGIGAAAARDADDC